MRFPGRPHPQQLEEQAGQVELRDRGEGRAGTIVAIGLAASMVVGTYVISDDLRNAGWSLFGDIPNVAAEIGDITEVDPIAVDVAVDHESVREDASFELSCLMLASVGVDIDSFANSGLGDGHWKTKYHLDFELCGQSEAVLVNEFYDMYVNEEHVLDNGEVVPVDQNIVTMPGTAYSPDTARIAIDEREDPITGEVLQANIILPSLEVHRPRPNALDERNCLSDTYKNSPEEIQEKLDERHRQIAEGENPECDNNFYIGGWLPLVGPEASEAITFGQAGAQLALMLDLQVPELIAKANREYGENVEDALRLTERYKDTDIVITFDNDVDEPYVATEMAERIEADKGFFSEIIYDYGVDDDGNTIVRANGYDGDFVEMTVTSDLVVNVEDLSVEPPVPTEEGA